MAENIVHLKTDNWKAQVEDSTLPVVVDFWAEWCNPCKQLAPIFEQLAQEFSGKMKFGKVNVDEGQELAARYGVRNLPTLLVIVKGTVSEQIVGFSGKEKIKAKLSELV